jgi:hypothetical protein
VKPPILLSGSEILKQVEDLDVTFGKSDIEGKRPCENNEGNKSQQWRKKSIFF